MSNVTKIRNATLGAKKNLRKEVVELEGGIKIEVRQPTQRSRSALSEKATKDGQIDNTLFMIHSVIELSFDPETGEKVFTDADVDAMLSEPSGDSYIDKLFDGVIKVMGANVDDAVKN